MIKRTSKRIEVSQLTLYSLFSVQFCLPVSRKVYNIYILNFMIYIPSGCIVMYFFLKLSLVRLLCKEGRSKLEAFKNSFWREVF